LVSNIPASNCFVGVDKAHIYWGAGTTFFACPVGACNDQATSVLASSLLFGGAEFGGAAVGGSGVFWADGLQSQIMEGDGSRCNSMPRTVAATTGLAGRGLGGIATDASNVYWADMGSNRVMTCPLSGSCAPTALVSTSAPPTVVAVDTGNVYWADTNYSV